MAGRRCRPRAACRPVLAAARAAPLAWEARRPAPRLPVRCRARRVPAARRGDALADRLTVVEPDHHDDEIRLLGGDDLARRLRPVLRFVARIVADQARDGAVLADDAELRRLAQRIFQTVGQPVGHGIAEHQNVLVGCGASAGLRAGAGARKSQSARRRRILPRATGRGCRTSRRNPELERWAWAGSVRASAPADARRAAPIRSSAQAAEHAGFFPPLQVPIGLRRPLPQGPCRAAIGQ